MLLYNFIIYYFENTIYPFSLDLVKYAVTLINIEESHFILKLIFPYSFYLFIYLCHYILIKRIPFNRYNI